MMDYEVFREVVSERIKDFLPPIFSSYKVKINTVRKVNEEKEALIMMPEKSGELTAMPNIYLDEMYEEFQKVEDLDVVLRLMAAMVIHYTGRFKPSEVDLDFKQKKDAIVMNLINTKKNRALLEHVPHKDVLDLSIVYRIIMAIRNAKGYGNEPGRTGADRIYKYRKDVSCRDFQTFGISLRDDQ